MPLLISKSNQEVSTSRLSAFLISDFIHNDNDLEASLHKPLNLYFGIDEIGSLKRYYFRDLAVIHIFLIFTWLFERFK